jgi:DNA-binding transcriptional ArsR family regulator
MSPTDATAPAEASAGAKAPPGDYIEVMDFGIHLAEVAALVGDPARANIMCALLDGRALTAKELAYAANVSPQTTSGHLAKLTEARLLTVVKQGRHRYYRLTTPLVSQMLEGIMAVAAHGPPRYRPSWRLGEAMRTARMCYDHIAGRLGVGLADALRERGHVVLTDDAGEVTDAGLTFLDGFGVNVEPVQRKRRALCRSCLDWSERRPHLGGAVGAALADRCGHLGWTERARHSRVLTITPEGRRGFSEVFGLSF